MSIGSIPVSEILAYCQFFDVPDREDFFRIIRAADNAYLTWHQQRANGN